MENDRVESLRRQFGGPMTEKEIEVLRDMQGFIEFAIRNGLSFALVISNLGHDVNGLAQYGFDLQDATKACWSPRVTGYSRISSESVGEPTEPIEST